MDTPEEHSRRAVAASARLLTAARLVGLVPAVVVAVLAGAFLAWWIGLLLLVVLALGWLGFIELRRRGVVDRALVSVGPTRPSAGDHPRWENVIDGLSSTTGVGDPELLVVESPSANAAALVHGGRVVLVATTGLADGLGQVELEAVGANLLARVRNGAAELSTVAVGLPGPGLAGSAFVTRTLVEGLGEQHAVRSDLDAAGLTRYPPGVARALRSIDERGTVVEGALPASAPLWLVPAVGAEQVPEPVAATVMQPTGLRVAVVEEL